MYLIHETELYNLYLILKDGELKSNQLTGRINQGSGVYPTLNKFVYFSLERKIFNNTTYAKFKLYFNPELLYNRNFYLSTVQSPEPEYVAKWKSSTENQIKIKHKKYSKNITKILEKQYYYNTDAFLFGQVAIKNKVDINKYLVAIEFIEFGELDKKNLKLKTKILNLVKKKYPNVIIKILSIEKNQHRQYFNNNINKESKHVSQINHLPNFKFAIH